MKKEFMVVFTVLLSIGALFGGDFASGRWAGCCSRGPDAMGINMKTEWLEAILKRTRELNLSVLGFDELPPVSK